MEHYAGIDVSLESASVCVVEAGGRIVREAKVAREPDALSPVTLRTALDFTGCQCSASEPVLHRDGSLDTG